MRSRMHPKYYLSQEIFDREQSKIFRKAWVFAGLKSFLPKHNSFITRKIVGIPVVIQNFNGELRAFENVCLHRSAPLQQGFTGTRPLVCPYHAWSYDSSGCVKKIPDCDAIYRIGDTEKNLSNCAILRWSSWVGCCSSILHLSRCRSRISSRLGSSLCSRAAPRHTTQRSS